MSDCDADSLSGQEGGRQQSNGQSQGKNGNAAAGQASGKGKGGKRRGKSGKKGKKGGRKEAEKIEGQGDVGGQGCVEPPGEAGEEAQGLGGWSRLKRVSVKLGKDQMF